MSRGWQVWKGSAYVKERSRESKQEHLCGKGEEVGVSGQLNRGVK